MSMNQLKDYPTDRTVSQARLFLSDRYKLGFDSRSEFLSCEFARKYLIYKKEDSTVFYNSMGESSEQCLKLSESDLDYLPYPLNQLLKKDDGNSKQGLGFLYGIGLVFFKPLFNKNSEIQKIWQKLTKISPEQTIKFIENLLSLPSRLRFVYAEAYSNTYQIAYKYHNLLEDIIRETMTNEDFNEYGMPFTYSDFIKDNHHENDEIPHGKVSGHLHSEFMEKLEEYYTELHNKLPEIKQTTPALSLECELLIKRTNSKTPISVFWARYFKDLFQEAYGKPYLKHVSTFINELFDTEYTEYNIANITRKNM